MKSSPKFLRNFKRLEHKVSEQLDDSCIDASHEQNNLQPEQGEDFLMRLGQMTRNLHDSLRGLGLDKLIEKAANEIPDARGRLDYVARMSEKAAQRVLNATDVASPLQDKIDAGAKNISLGWTSVMAKPFSEENYQSMADQTLQYLDESRRCVSETKAQLLDIMMAQDFQDLTGQVIKKVTEIAQNLEQQLVQMLIDFSPAEARREVSSGLLNGPQIDPVNTEDVVADQEQVDDLLDSLGF
jgi:chemotaxis protein CheZ